MTRKDTRTELEKRLEAEAAAEAEQEAKEGVQHPDGGEGDEPSAWDAETVDDATRIAGLTEELEACAAERDDLKDQLLRARAEFDNYRKRTAREMEHVRKTAAEALILALLPGLDNLERALEHAPEGTNGFAEGVAMVRDQFQDVLAARGVEPIPALGEPFDPNVHEAMSHLPSDTCPADHVMTEYERGYRIGNHVLRPAKVVVSSGPPQAAEAAPDNEDEQT